MSEPSATSGRPAWTSDPWGEGARNHVLLATRSTERECLAGHDAVIRLLAALV